MCNVVHLKKLPLGNPDFPLLRQTEAIYVDKTDLIYKLAKGNSNFIFLARPRRFGKSLLVSTFQSLFQDGLKDFDGLAISQQWNEPRYPVIRLDLSGAARFENCEEFRHLFYRQLRIAFGPAGFVDDGTGDTMERLLMWLQGCSTGSLVLLIDEYDAPLTNCLDHLKLLDKVRNLISIFFDQIKRYFGAFRFIFITGVTKLSSTGIFSGFNNLKDISYSSEYSTLLGYTEEELRQYFPAHLQKASSFLNLSEDNLIDKLRSYYDGFSFDLQGKNHVFCPWSILSFFDNEDFNFDNFWFQTGGQPNVLKKYLVHHKLEKPENFDEIKTIFRTDLVSPKQYDLLSLDILLTQAGYLTVKSGDSFQVQIGYPNREVRLSMANLYAQELIKEGHSLQSSTGVSPAVALASLDVDSVIKMLNLMFNSIDYDNYPVSNEASVRSHLQCLLMGAALIPDVEKHSALGRSDLEVNVDSRRWIFEFKYARKSSDVDRLLNLAVHQMQTKAYGKTLNSKALIRVAAVFEAEKRQITAWKALTSEE